MKLALMKFRDEDGNVTTRKCAVNMSGMGGEYTVCGCACPDSRLGSEDFECIGEAEGKPTCPECKNIIKWFKQLK